MDDTSDKRKIETRRLSYFRQRFKNRVFSHLVEFFAREAEVSGVTKRDIASKLNRDPAQITRWLSNPSNLTLETISDLLLALNAEPNPPKIVKFSDAARRNYTHPFVESALETCRVERGKGASEYFVYEHSKKFQLSTKNSNEVQNLLTRENM